MQARTRWLMHSTWSQLLLRARKPRPRYTRTPTHTHTHTHTHLQQTSKSYVLTHMHLG
jgi:hypothetical protein